LNKNILLKLREFEKCIGEIFWKLFEILEKNSNPFML